MLRASITRLASSELRLTSPQRASSTGSAAWETISERWPITSATPAAEACSTVTSGMLRKLFADRALLGVRATSSIGRAPPHLASASAAAWSTARSRRRAVEDRDRPAVGVNRERRAERLAAGLAVDLDRVAARLRAERDAAAPPVGNAERADARAPGALLAPGLGGRHRDLAAPERGGGAAPAGVRLGAGGVVDERLVEALVEEGRGQVRLGLLAERRRLDRASAIGPHLDRAVLRAGDGAAEHQQMRSASISTTSRLALGDALAAHPPGHANALEDAGRVGAGADRAGRADVVRAVRDRPAAEAVALDRALEPLADGDPGDLDALAGLELLDRRRVAHLRPVGRAEVLVAELDERPHRCRAGLLAGGRARPS